MSAERVELRITGRVQGVFYRASCADEARRLGLVGWVRNVADGSVEAVAEGPRAALDALVEWCRRGPPAARVDDVQARWGAASGEFATFAVRR
ncbi:MAG TPA: acylphosphatase [Vulgatibacter sp.]|nr:acylphosphatase [Vulgatibacter sp.]